MSTDTPSASPIRLGLIAVLVLAVAGAAAWAVINERGDDAVVASIDDYELTFSELEEILAGEPVEGQGVTATEDMANASQLVAVSLLIEGIANDLDAVGYDAADYEAGALAALAADPNFDPASASGAWLVRRNSVQAALDAWSTDETLAQSGPATEGPEYLCSSHILLETFADAEEVIALLDDGADFATVAMERSIGPTGPAGGDLGCVDAASFVPEFTIAAQLNGPGITPPVETQFGWHVINVRSVGPLSAENHPEIPADQLEQLLFDEETRVALGEEFIQAAIARVAAESEVDPRFGVWDPVAGRLDPPSGVRG